MLIHKLNDVFWLWLIVCVLLKRMPSVCGIHCLLTVIQKMVILYTHRVSNDYELEMYTIVVLR